MLDVVTSGEFVSDSVVGIDCVFLLLLLALERLSFLGAALSFVPVISVIKDGWGCCWGCCTKAPIDGAICGICCCIGNAGTDAEAENAEGSIRGDLKLLWLCL